MEGKYTKISVYIGIAALLIALWQLRPQSRKQYSGEWQMTSTINNALYKEYIGKTVQWKLHLVQSENHLSGTAEKIGINQANMSFKDRTAIQIQGTVDDNDFVLTYTEKGKLRETSGIFKGRFSENTFSGTFTSTASDSNGDIAGTKTEK